MNNSKNNSVCCPVADPAAFGLLGLAMITLIVGVEQLGYLPNTNMILPWALMLGGITQLIAGIMDFKRNNLFGATAFSPYGVFCIAVALIWTLRIVSENLWIVQGMTVEYGLTIGWMSVGWLIFTAYMTYGAAGISKLMTAIFLIIDLVFITLIAHFFFGVPVVYAGMAHLALSAASFYGSAAVVLNSKFNRTVLPTGAPLIH